jgi:hypothetical protein
LVTTKSVAIAIAAIARLVATPRRYLPATALEGLVEAQRRFGQTGFLELQQRYGSQRANLDRLQAEYFSDCIRVLIFSAWKRRRKVARRVVFEADCLCERDPVVRGELIVFDPPDCALKALDPCGLAEDVAGRKREIDLIRIANKKLAASPERERRARVLKELSRKPKQKLSKDDCKALGDAMFAILAPAGRTILTTNRKDHEPLAQAVGRAVASP